MLIARASQVGVQAALLLAMEAHRAPQRVRELSPKLGVPAAYLAKVLHNLARAGVLRSVRGLGGGFQLARPACEIPLWQVLAALEPFGRLDTCLLGLGACNEELTCPLHNEWVPIRNQILTLLQTKTLAELAAKVKQGKCSRFAAIVPPLQIPESVCTNEQPR